MGAQGPAMRKQEPRATFGGVLDVFSTNSNTADSSVTLTPTAEVLNGRYRCFGHRK